jgi:hypothetical protein
MWPILGKIACLASITGPQRGLAANHLLDIEAQMGELIHCESVCSFHSSPEPTTDMLERTSSRKIGDCTPGGNSEVNPHALANFVN